MDPNSFSFSGINWLALVLAIVFNMVLGFVWYARWSPTGKVWMREMKVPVDAKPSGGQMAKGLILMVVGSFLTFFVFAHNVWVYLDADRNIATGGDATYKLGLMDGIMGGFFTWLGFFLPQQLSGISWENKPLSLFFVNSGYQLVSMLVAGILMVTVGHVG